jgi:glycerophosphoryl diester phosphodiesterase
VGRLLAVVAVVLALAVPASAAAVPPSYVHAHRGGTYVNGVPSFAEASLQAFQAAANAGFVLEADARLTADKLPVVMHDITLDRTTNCTGAVKSRTAAYIAANCRIDVLGSPNSGLPSIQIPNSAIPVPTVAQFMNFARAVGARVNLEIKNVPTDSDFDVTHDFAQRVMSAVIASGIPHSRVIIQSFWPPNLTIAKLRSRGVQTALLTQPQLEAGGPVGALLFGANWVSPSWPLTLGPLYVTLSHALGKKVVPYTLNTPAEVQAAHAAGVDAVISDDPYMALAALP